MQPIELYNLKTDPGELENPAAAYPEMVTKPKGLMEEAHAPL